MGRRSRYTAQRRAILKMQRYAWDNTEPLCTWREYRREHWADTTEMARLIFTDSRRVKQAATSEPKNYGPFNRAVRRYLKRNPKEMERLAQLHSEKEAQSHE